MDAVCGVREIDILGANACTTHQASNVAKVSRQDGIATTVIRFVAIDVVHVLA